MKDPAKDPATRVQDLQYFGEFGGVNPSITDSSTFTFLKADRMEEIFEKEIEGCYLYSRHWNPTNRYLAEALAQMEGTESAQVMGSGMGAITSFIMQLCEAGSHIVASRTIYGGTYAFLKNYLPKFNISVTFIDQTDLKSIENAIQDNTKMVYCEALSNPLLEVADIPAIKKLAQAKDIPLVVDNTFTPLVLTPAELGADIVVHSLTKFINGSSDTMGGAVCASKEFIDSLMDVNTGSAMLLGPSMDSMRSASILKNLRTLHLRMKQHSENALYVATQFEKDGISVKYPGLKSHPQNAIFENQMNEAYGHSGMILINVGTKEKGYSFMEHMQNENIGYLAVSLGFYKTLFSAPGSSTSSEIPMEEQEEMGLGEGLIRMSVGIDMDVKRTYEKMKDCMKKAGIL